MITSGTDLLITYRNVTGATVNTQRLYVEEDGLNYDNGATITWATGNGATALGWTQAQQATPGSTGTTAWEGSYISFNSAGPYDAAGFMNGYATIFNNYRQFQIQFDPDIGLWPATQKAAWTSWTTSAAYPYQYIARGTRRQAARADRARPITRIRAS
jgi:hypothetical protein